MENNNREKKKDREIKLCSLLINPRKIDIIDQNCEYVADHK